MTSALYSSQEVQRAIAAPSNLLITGPTGTGKSRLAREIHAKGPRSKSPFVEINLATLHEGTLESELFGSERGAFTGADARRAGRIVRAQGGTLFLDEIGEMPLSLQARLLDLLQNKRIYALGSSEAQRVDSRIIVATHRNLPELVAQGKFRADLFYRLRVMSIETFPLVEAKDFFGEIVHQVLDELSSELSVPLKKVEQGCALLLETYSWPGNIRELRNVLEAALLFSNGEELKVSDLPAWFLTEHGRQNGVSGADPSGFGREGDASVSLAELMAKREKELIYNGLSRSGGGLRAAARALKMSPATLLRRTKKYGLSNKIETMQ